MPPKAKFTKEEIIKAALEIVRRDGFEALTARALGKELGSSPRPIFTVFRNMEEVEAETVAAAKAIYERYEDEGMQGVKPFKGSGSGYIRFAAEHPKLFQLLFMKEQERVFDSNSVLSRIDDYYEKILQSIQTEYGFSRETAQAVYLHSWIYSHGIAVLIATKVCEFSEGEISAMLDEAVGSIIRRYKAEGRI